MPVAIPKSVAQTLRPKPRLPVSEWATYKPFRIREKGAVRPGPYDLSFTPYFREPLDAVGLPHVTAANWVCCPQGGKTKAAEVVLDYWAEHQPDNVMYVRPTIEDVKEAMRDRWRPVIETNLPHLIPARGEWCVISENPAISLTNMMIYGAAATIERQLTSRTTPKIIYDETDTGGDTGNQLGNVLDLLDQRQMAATISRQFKLGCSSPKWDSGSNWMAYDQRSDRREYHEPCPLCGGYQLLKMSMIKCREPKVRDKFKIIGEQLAHYECEHCGGLIPQSWQGWMADRGFWLPRDRKIAEVLPIDDKAIVDRHSLTITPESQRWEPHTTGDDAILKHPHRGYHIWRAQTKFEAASWSHILGRWFEVHASRDPERLQVFVNSDLALPWKQAVEPADEVMLRDRIGGYAPRIIPTRAKVLLCAVDVQSNCLWYRFRAFGPNQESWGIHEGTVEVQNDAYMAAFDTVYEMAFVEGFPIAGEDEETGLKMRAYAMAVDSGYRTDDVYEFARRPGIIAIKGWDYRDYRVRVSQVEGKKRPDPLNLYHLNVRAFKDRLQRLIKIAPDEKGAWHLHADTTEEFITHLTAEHLVGRKTNPKIKTWQLRGEGRPNHLLDCEAYILGLAEALEQRREVSIMTVRDTDPRWGEFRRSKDSPPPVTPRARKKRSKRKPHNYSADAPTFSA